MKIESTASWDNQFFEEFVTFKNKIHHDIPSSFISSVADYQKYFSPDSVFAEDFSWRAFMVKKEGVVVAQAILCWKVGTAKGNLGFLDWENDLDAAKLLVDNVCASAKENHLKSLKTPVNINFFIKYRIKKPGSGKAFWGEPIYPDYYHALFIKTGFGEIRRWDTYRLNIFHGIKDFFIKRKKLAMEGVNKLSPTIRCVRMRDWDNELKIIHGLFIEAYKSMPEWEPLTFEQFKTVYYDYKYIINPWYSYIVELDGKPVGFNINYTDPLRILKEVEGRSLTIIQRFILFLKLRFNFSTFLFAHIGKIPGPNGEEIKGLQIQASKRLQFFVMFMGKALVTFQMTNSPSRRSFDSDSQTTYAQYVLYGREFQD